MNTYNEMEGVRDALVNLLAKIEELRDTYVAGPLWSKLLECESSARAALSRMPPLPGRKLGE